MITVIKIMHSGVTTQVNDRWSSNNFSSGGRQGSETPPSPTFYSCFLPPSEGIPASLFYFYCKMLPNIVKFFSFSPSSCHFRNPAYPLTPPAFHTPSAPTSPGLPPPVPPPLLITCGRLLCS